MKNSVIAQRQNHPKAIELIKASYRCFRAERIIKYIMIFLSFGVCLAAIFNRYLPQMASSVENIEKIQQDASTYLNLISGAIIVAGIPLGFYSSRMHTEGTVLQDRYEAYVFENKPNLSILRPISDTYIELYAKKAHKDDSKFYDRIYGEKFPKDDSRAQFEYIKKEVHSDYNLYVWIQPFFLTIWVGFCILVIIIAVSFNDMFVTTLINIMIPSLSAITTIGNSWYACRLQMRQLTNLMTCIDRIESLPPDLFKNYISDKQNMRLLADGLFNYRSSAFVIPNFLVKLHQRSIEKTKLAALAKSTGETDKNAAANTVTSSTAAADASPSPTVKTTTSSRTASPSKNTAKTPAKANNESENSAENTKTDKSAGAAKSNNGTAKSSENVKTDKPAAKSTGSAKTDKSATKSTAAKSATTEQTDKKEEKAKTASVKTTPKAERKTAEKSAKDKDDGTKQPSVKTAKNTSTPKADKSPAPKSTPKAEKTSASKKK